MLKKNYLTPSIDSIEIMPIDIIATSNNSNTPNVTQHSKELEEKQKALDNLKSVIEQLEQEEKENFPEKIDPKDKYIFYGIDLQNSPTDSWTFMGAKTSSKGGKIEDFILDLPTGPTCPFKKCTAKIIEESVTNYIFEAVPFNEDKALNIIFLFERNILRDGEYTHEECRNTYVNQVREGYTHIYLNGPAPENLKFSLGISPEEMDLTIHTSFLNPNRPQLAKDFVPDMYSVFNQGIKMLSASIVLCQINGEVAGTKELIEGCNQVMFETIKRDMIPVKDRGIASIMQKGEELLIDKVEDGFIVCTKDKATRVGYVPSGLDSAIDIFYKQNFIKDVRVLDNNSGNPRVIASFGM